MCARRRLAATSYGYAFLCDLVPLYPVYALLFGDTGLSVAQISSLFVLWSVTGVLAELPTGVWADTVSRRAPLALGPLVTGAGFALWVLFPSYPAFAAGFVLWGTGGALTSGAQEALVHEELVRLGAPGDYARVMGRSRAAGLTGVVAAMAVGGHLVTVGGYAGAGAASVASCLLASATAALFPRSADWSRSGGGEVSGATAAADGPDCSAGPAAADGPDGPAAVDASAAADGPDGLDSPAASGAPDGDRPAPLRSALTEARRNPSVRRALLLVPVVTAVWGALDEYTPLLVRETGVPGTSVSWWLLLIWAGTTVGGLLAGPGGRLGRAGYAVLLAVSGVALAVGALVRVPVGLVLVAFAFCGFQLATVLADARLQERIQGTGRATLTSLAAVGTELVTVAVYGGYAAVGGAFGNASAFAAFALPYLLTALCTGLPRRPHRKVRHDLPPGGSRTR